MAGLTQEKVKRLFSYNPWTGVLTRRVSAGCAKAGSVAGCRYSNGYLNVGIQGKIYKAHRLAWLYVYGSFPKHHTDHIDGVRDNNRIHNLRSVTHRENQKNQKVPCTNTSGVMGVNWDKPLGKWKAQIMAEGKKKNLGYFNIKEDAMTARKSAELEFGYHKNHGRAA
jgi:hypothetical protein